MTDKVNHFHNSREGKQAYTFVVLLQQWYYPFNVSDVLNLSHVCMLTECLVEMSTQSINFNLQGFILFKQIDAQLLIKHFTDVI
jgi:hypothetical protein